MDMTALSREERRKRALKLLDQVGLVTRPTNILTTCLGAETAGSNCPGLASDPQIIIADEPTGPLIRKIPRGSDPADQIAKDGKLVIAVTHSQKLHHGTRVVHLADGKIDGDERLRPAYDLPKDPTVVKSQQLPAMASYRMSFKHLMYNFWRNSLIMLGTAIGILPSFCSAVWAMELIAIQNQINSLTNPRSITVFKNPTGKHLTQDQIQSSLMQNLPHPSQ